MFCTARKIFIQYFTVTDLSPPEVRMAAAALTPSVTWAQRNDLVFLSINVPDVSMPEIKVTSFM